MLAFPDCQMLDGPLQMFAGVNDELGRQAYELVIAAPKRGPFQTSSGIGLVTDLAIADVSPAKCRASDTLIAAGGDLGLCRALESGEISSHQGGEASGPVWCRFALAHSSSQQRACSMGVEQQLIGASGHIWSVRRKKSRRRSTMVSSARNNDRIACCSESLSIAATSVLAQGNPLRNAYFGETHVHTSWSLARPGPSATVTGPGDAYKYFKGETIKAPLGYDVRIDTPLDFAGVTDHSEYVGVVKEANDPSSPISRLPAADQLILKNNSPEEAQQVFPLRRHSPDGWRAEQGSDELRGRAHGLGQERPIGEQGQQRRIHRLLQL